MLVQASARLTERIHYSFCIEVAVSCTILHGHATSHSEGPRLVKFIISIFFPGKQYSMNYKHGRWTFQ
jgi:hypothetical protein